MVDIMYTLIKGVVRKKTKHKLCIELVNGKRFWTTINHSVLDIRDFVWISWDYTQEKASLVLTKTELQIFLQQQSESVEFSDPVDEEIMNEEVVNAQDEQWLNDNSFDM